MNAPTAQPRTLEGLKVACSSCNLRELCLPIGLSQPDLERLDGLVALRKPVPRGQALFRTGDPFRSVARLSTFQHPFGWRDAHCRRLSYLGAILRHRSPRRRR